MNRKILIGIGVVIVCSIVSIYRVSLVRHNVVRGERHHDSESSAIVRESPIGNSNNKPRRSQGTGEDIEHLKSNISAVLESKQARDEKMDRARNLLIKLSSLEGSAKTIKWLKDTVGDGTDFIVLVSGIFEGSNEPLDVLFKEIDSLPASAKSVVSTVLFQKIIESDEPEKIVQSLLSSSDPDSLNDGMGLALKLIFLQSDSIDASMRSMRSIMNKLDGKCLIKFRDAYLVGLSSVSPKNAWKEMQMLGEGSLDANSWQPSLRDKISAQLRSLGAGESLEFLIQEGGSASDVAKSVAMWGNMNPVELNKWVSNQMKNLPASQQDGVRSGMASLLLDKRDFSAVQEQMESIVDIGVRSDIERRLLEGQREAIKQEVLKDPNGTLMAIVSNSSHYDDYLLEEAMNTWIAKDPAKAEEWYQNNWKLLPATKSQYVAAAYANEALKQGDTEGASQWVAYIKDPKTKQRIQDGINKGAANARN